MKKLIFLFSLVATMAFSQQFRSESFLSDVVATNAAVTNVLTVGTNGMGGFSYGGITISNAASAPLGGFTNILSWLSTANGTLVGTNALKMTWTNNSGTWVIPTNNTPGSVSGIKFVTNDATMLVRDVPLWTDRNGQLPATITTNNWTGDASAFALSPLTLTARIWGDTSAGGTLNLIFVGLPDGVNEPTATTAGVVGPVFQWGIAGAAGVTTITTNFPAWKFAGCKAVRLRSGAITTATAANIDVTLQSLTLTGFSP